MMNIPVISTGAGKGSQNSGVIYAGNLMMNRNAGLKSTQQKQERQQKMQSEVAFWEKQKEGLKDMECATVEEIAEKLERLHTYEDSITAAKQAYNSEQMWHTMDEARELGEKIAEAAEKMAPKTEEERKKEAAEEAVEAAAGTEESDGMLEELLEAAGELAEDLAEENEKLFDTMDETDVDITEESLKAAEQERDEAELRMEQEAEGTLMGKMGGKVPAQIAEYDSYHAMQVREWYTAYRGMDLKL